MKFNDWVILRENSGIRWEKCPDSPDGKHHFTPDLEYDRTGKTVNCEYCGMAEPKTKKCECESTKCKHGDKPCNNTATEVVKTIHGKYNMCKQCAANLPSIYKKK